MRRFALTALLLMLPSCALGQWVLGARNYTPASIGGGSVLYVNSGTNAYSGTTVTMSPNPVAGNLILVGIDVAASNTVSISGTGSGCPSSWVAVTGSPSTMGSGAWEWMWTGVAAASASCQITTTYVGGGSMGINYAQLSGQASSSWVDSYGSCSSTSSTGCTATANRATTLANDYAVGFCSSDGPTPSSTGWTLRINNTYDFLFTMGSIASGTTVTFPVTGFAGGQACIFATILP